MKHSVLTLGGVGGWGVGGWGVGGGGGRGVIGRGVGERGWCWGKSSHQKDIKFYYSYQCCA